MHAEPVPEPAVTLDFTPEPPGELLEACALVGGPVATALLRELVRQDAPIALRRRGDPDTHGFGRLVASNDSGIEVIITDAEATGVLVTTDEDYVAVGFLDGIKIQFDASLSETATGPGEHRLRGANPAAVYRLQRREAYRVRIPPGRGFCTLRTKTAEETLAPVIDLSARGLSLSWQDAELPPAGTIWKHARLELADHPPLPCTLRTRRLVPSDEGRLVGCEFIALPPEIERAVQVLVNELQRAERLGR